VMVKVGKVDAALNYAQQAVALDPINASVHRDVGRIMENARRYRDAIAAEERALALNPELDSVNGVMGRVYLELGEPDRAAHYCATPPLNWINYSCLAMAYGKLGNAEQVRKAMAGLDGGWGVEISAYQYAQIAAQRGDTDQALKLLEKALRVKDSGLGWVRGDPLVDPLRAEPRFKAVLARLGLPEK